MASELPSDEHVILPRPYISAFFNKNGDVTITVIGVSEDNQNVETESVEIPVECAAELGRALIRLAKR